MEVLDGATVEITSALASTKLNNVKFWVREGNFLCSVPMLDWTSVETVAVSSAAPCLLAYVKPGRVQLLGGAVVSATASQKE